MGEDLFKDIGDFLKEMSDADVSESILTESERQRIISSLAIRRGVKGFTEDEAFNLLQWAQKVRIDESLLNLLLQELVDVDWVNDEPTFKITNIGTLYATGDTNGIN